MSEEQEEYNLQDFISFDYQLKRDYNLLYHLVYLQRKIIIICITPASINKDQSNNFKLSTIFYNSIFKSILCPELIGFDSGISIDKDEFIKFCNKENISFLIP